MTKNGVQDATTDEATIRRWWTETPWANIGLATGHDGRVVMDIDDAGEKTGSASLEELTRANGPLPETLVVETGSGGLHYYFQSTEEIANSANKVGKNIDIRGRGGYVILPPSNHASGGHYTVKVEAPIAEMPKWLEKRCLGKVQIDVTGDVMDENDPVVRDGRRATDEGRKFTPKQLLMLLDFIPPDCDRETWWQVGAALKKELGEKGYRVWDEWSRKALDKYDPKVMPVQWDSFRDEGITGGTIFHYAKTLGGFRGFNEETASQAKFVDAWVWVNSIKRFVDKERFLEYDKEQFDATYARDFTRGRASDHVLRSEAFQCIEGATYAPEGKLEVVEDGIRKLNYWRPSGLTPAPGPVDLFTKHIDYLYPDGNEGKILLQYLAHQVQRPGEKVHWAVLLEGNQGTGKSYFAAVMRLVLGSHNVRNVNNETLHETFTGWQRNTQLIVVEEMMAKGRLELMNKLKPMITEPWCTIREMYRPPYEQPNRFNFLFFSNHKDSIIIDDTDRRYCILKSNAKPHPDRIRYYAPLFDWTRRNGPALLHYLKHEVDLSDFQAKAHAPMTEGKRALILQSYGTLETTLYELVQARQYPFHWDLHQLDLLLEPLAKRFNCRTNLKELGSAFERLGYRKIERRVDLVQSKCRLWIVRDSALYEAMTPDQLRTMWANQLNGAPLGQRVEDFLAAADWKKSMDGQMPRNLLVDDEPA